MANEFKVRKGLIVQGSGSAILDIFGSQGQLFSVTDSLSGSLFSVNDISGIPIMEVFSDNTIKLGTYNQEAIIISGSRTGMGTALPQAELHISGANNDSLFRIQSPASSSIIFVSGSGNVGVGTLTPTQKVSVDNGNVGFTSGFGVSWDSDTEWIRRAAASDQLQFATQNTVRLNIGSTQGQLVTIGLGATTGTAQFQVRGGGATSATTAMRIEDSGGNARFTILDDGTSAFNTSHLYVSSSGRIGVGTATPTIGILDINGIARVRSTNQLYFGGTGASDWQGGISGQSNGLLVNLNVLTINNSGYASPATQSFAINTSQNVAIGPHVPTARLHVSGASNAVLFEIDSPAINNIIYVSGSGRVGINTSSSLATGLSIFQQSSSFMSPETAPTGSGLYVFSSGSGNTQPSIHVQNIGDAFASINLSTISGSTNPLRMWSLSKRNNANANALQLYYYNGTTYSFPLFNFIQNGVSTLGESTQIQLDDLNGFVGLQITPTEWIHLSSDPASSKYILINADQTSNPPPLTAASTAKNGYGIVGNENYLAEPDYWMEIKLGAAGDGIVLIPCYLPG
jgi:hypothetical protein